MEIMASHKNGKVPVTVFHIKGALTAESSETLEQQAKSAFEAGTRNLLLDLTDVKFVSSGGLRTIHRIFMLLRGDTPEESDESVRKGITAGTYRSPFLKLLKPSRHVLEALKLAGFDMFLEIHTNLQGAVTSYQAAGS